ncbi:MAG: DUF1552 domain-containing protein [Oligoflexales bacterium]|nr:DUF1552 domain-containing protein [Oligoflexales bacterium]
MNNKIISRRSFSKSLSASALTPWLLDQFFLSRKLFAQQGQTAAKRIIFVVSPNGVFPGTWTLNANPSESLLASKLQLAPLKDHFANLGFVYGLKNECKVEKSHRQAPLSLLTSVNPTKVGNNWISGGISIDQLIANQYFNPAVQRFRSLNLSASIPESYKSKTESMISFSGPGEPIDPLYSASSAFSTIFGGGGGGGGGGSGLCTTQADCDEQKALLDRLISDLNIKRSALPNDQLTILNQHLQILQEKKTLLIPPSEGGSTCQVPNNPGAIPELDLQASSTHMIDLMVHAMRCNLSNVGTLMLCEEGAAHNFESILGAGFGNFHGHTHAQDLNNPNDANSQKVQKIVAYYAGRVAYLIERLKATPDSSGTGTLFDNTIVVWTSSLQDGFSHKRRSMPIVYATGSNALKTQRIFSYNEENHGRFLITLAKAMGMNLNSFGNSTGALTDILA